MTLVDSAKELKRLLLKGADRTMYEDWRLHNLRYDLVVRLCDAVIDAEALIMSANVTALEARAIDWICLYAPQKATLEPQRPVIDERDCC